MNARGLLVTCLTLILVSIILIPASAYFGFRADAASSLSSLTLLGGMVAAFMTVRKDRGANDNHSVDRK